MSKIERIKRTFIGLSFILTPLILVAAFAAHPNLMSLDVMTSGEAFAEEFRNNYILEIGHIAVMFAAILFMGITVGFCKMLESKKPWLSLSVLITGIFGSFMLGVDKGAFALVPSAFNTLPDNSFQLMTPGLHAMINYEGAMWLAQLYFFIPVSMILAGIGLHLTGSIKKWQSTAIIIGSLLYFNPDIDLISLIASLIISIALIPLGIKLLMNNSSNLEPGSVNG